MAKMKYYMDLEYGLSKFGDDTHLKTVTKNKAVWVDQDTGARMKLEGKNFSRDDSNSDYLDAGRIEKLTVTAGKGDVVVTVEDLNVKAVKVFKQFEKGGFEGVVNFITKGDDIQVGSKNADIIFGGGGNDVLTGKGGSDIFIFGSQNPNAKPEHDVITDFKTTGPNSDWLSIDLNFDTRAKHGGKDTLLEFADDSTLLLKNVTKAEFETYWDAFF